MPHDPVTSYAQDVVAGRIVAGKLVILACKRHLADLKSAGIRGLHWDANKAILAIAFIGLLRHFKDRWAGKPFELSPWQCFIVGMIFGWRRGDGTRRFRIAHLEVARKNGKTALAAAIGLALFILEGEPGAEIYTVATKRDQARITHNYAVKFAQRSPAIRRRVVINRDCISIDELDAKYSTLTSESETQDGLNPSVGIMDELHAWRDRLLWDVIETGMGARTQPLILITTTAGFDRSSIWWERRQLAIAALNETIPDDEIFAYIATLDAEDDWTDPKNWIKGNPNLGVTIREDELAKRIKDAKASPGRAGAIKRLRLNIPTDAAEAAFNLDRWDHCEADFTEEDLEGRRCFGALDLSTYCDLAAQVLLFPPDDDDPTEPYVLLPRFWLPEEDLIERCHIDGFDYDVCAEEGLIELIPGRINDPDFIAASLLRDAERFELELLAVDRWRATKLGKDLIDHGLAIKGHGQGYRDMNPALVEFERLLEACRFAQNGHRLLRWCISNCAVEQDHAGNRKPSKRKSAKRIDGAVAAIMTCGAMLDSDGDFDHGGPLEL